MEAPILEHLNIHQGSWEYL